VSLYPLLSSTVFPPSVSTSHCKVSWFCVTTPTAVFYILSKACQYHTIYSLLGLGHYVHCCLLQSVHCLSVPHTVKYVGSVSLYSLLSSKVFPLSVSTSHSTVSWFCVTMSTAVFYNLSTVCQYLTKYCFCSVSLCPLLSSTVCPLSVSTSYCTLCWFCVTMTTAVFCSLSTVCQYLTLYSLLVLCHYAHCCLLHFVQCLSVPHNLQPVGSGSLCPMLSSTFCPMSVSTTQFTACWVWVTMSTAVF